MHLEQQELLLGHRILVAGKTIERDDRGVALLEVPANERGQLARRELGGIHLQEGKAVAMLGEVHAQSLGAPVEVPARLVEADEERALAAREGLQDELHRE